MADDKDKQPDFIPAETPDFIPAGGGRLEPPPRSLYEKVTERQDWAPFDWAHPVRSAGREALIGLGNFGAGAIKSGVGGIAGIPHMIAHPYQTITEDIPNMAIQMGRDIGEGHPEYVAGELGGAYLGGKALGAVPKAIPGVMGAIGSATRLPPEMPAVGEAVGKGELRPWTKLASQVGGAGVGGGIGLGLGALGVGEALGPYGHASIPYLAGGLGYKLGPGLADLILPRNPTPIGEPPLARLEMAEDLTKRSEAHQARVEEAEAARQKELGQMERLREQDAQARMRREREQGRLNEPVFTPMSESPYATQQAAARSFAEGKPGPFSRLSESPNKPPEPGWSVPLPGRMPPRPSVLPDITAGGSLSTIPRIGGPLMPPAGAGPTTATSPTPFTFQAALPKVVEKVGGEGPGVRPSPSEADITNIVRKRVVTPEEASAESRELGTRAPRRPGEGLMEREARLLGEARARRAAKGMKEPE